MHTDLVDCARPIKSLVSMWHWLRYDRQEVDYNFRDTPIGARPRRVVGLAFDESSAVMKGCIHTRISPPTQSLSQRMRFLKFSIFWPRVSFVGDKQHFGYIVFTLLCALSQRVYVLCLLPLAAAAPGRAPGQAKS